MKTITYVVRNAGGVIIDQREVEVPDDVGTEYQIDQLLLDSLATLQVIIDDTNANINTNPAARIKDMARVQRRIIRRVIGKLDGTA